MAFQSYCYVGQSFIIVPQQMSISKWHQLTNYKSPRLIWHFAGSYRGLLLISALPKPPEHFIQWQENSPFGILLPFFMKWFCSVNKGSLGQLNLCLCAWSVQGGKDMCLYWCLWHYIYIVCVCVLVLWSRNQFQLRKHFQYFQNCLDKMCLLYWFQILIPSPPFLGKWYYFQSTMKVPCCEWP